jgi:hypothetical protein
MNHVFNVKTWEECEARISEIVAIHALFDDTPASLRKEVLTMLDRFTLNAFSLFEDDNSLMETLAFREVDLKPPRLTAYS